MLMNTCQRKCLCALELAESGTPSGEILDRGTVTDIGKTCGNAVPFRKGGRWGDAYKRGIAWQVANTIILSCSSSRSRGWLLPVPRSHPIYGFVCVLCLLQWCSFWNQSNEWIAFRRKLLHFSQCVCVWIKFIVQTRLLTFTKVFVASVVPRSSWKNVLIGT